MSAKKSAKKTPSLKETAEKHDVDAANDLGIVFEALRTFAEDMDPDRSPHQRLFLLMLAERGEEILCREPPVR